MSESLTLWPSSKCGELAAQYVVVSYCFCCLSVRRGKEKEGCTTVHTFTPRMKNALNAYAAPRLEIYHPRTVHIFSRALDMNEMQTTTDASACASVVQRPRREALFFGTAFPGVTSALKRRRTPGYSPTTPPGWYSQPRTVHIFHEVSQVLKELDSKRGHEMMYHMQGDGAWRNKFLHGTHDFASCCHAVFPTASIHTSLQKTAPMCINFKNLVRFASHAARLTCTRNSIPASISPQKWCITTYTDVCTTHSVSLSAPAACSAVDVSWLFWFLGFVFLGFPPQAAVVPPGRPPWNGTPGATNQEGVRHRAHFLRG